MTEKIALFVDVQNVYYTTRQVFGGQFDYFKFWDEVTRDREVVSATAYATDKGDGQQKKFQDALRKVGFDVKLRPVVHRKDGSAKADWDVGITIDVLETGRNVDVIVLVTGDGDFDVLARKMIDDYDVDFEVHGVAELSANSIKMNATRFVPIDGRFLKIPPRKN